MEQRSNASLTVEAALLYPMLFLLTFLLVRITVYRYREVQNQAGQLYDAVVAERTMETPELLRAADVAFSVFGE